MTLLNTLLEISIYSIVLFGAIWLFRILLKKHLSAVMLYAVWFILIARLLMPVTITSGISFFTMPTSEQPTAYTEGVDLSDMFNNTAAPSGNAPYNMAHTTQQELQKDQLKQNNLVQSDTISSTFGRIEITWEMVLVALWLAGIAVMLIQISISVLKLNKRIKSAKTVPAHWQRIAEQLQTELNIKQRVRLVMIEGFPSPALCGGIKPVIVLPCEMTGKSEESVRFALLHELTHIKRCDHIVSILLLLLRAVYWFNPVVWLMMKQMRVDIETACDSCLTKSMPALAKKRYAGTMLSMYAQQQIRYVLGMSMGQTKKTAERRLRGMFMRSRSSRKGKMIAILLTTVLLVTCFTTACQPTPEKPVVIGKDQDKMLEQVVQMSKASQEDGTAFSISDMNVPENYTFSTAGADGKLVVSVDASVRLPDADILPTAKVVPGRFTQEMVSGMLDYLFGDTPYYQLDSRMTKVEVNKRILDLQQSISEGDFDEHPESLEDAQENLKDWQSRLDTAPKEREEPKLSDGTMIEDVVKGAYYIDVNSIDEESGSGAASFNCYSINEQSRGTGGKFDGVDNCFLYYSDYSSEDDDYYNYTMDGAQRVYSDEDIPNDLKNKLGVTLDKAKLQVRGLLDAAGIDDMLCTAAFVIDDHGTGHVDDYSGAASDFAFNLVYTRSVNGVPVMPTSEFAQNGREKYDYSWVYESLKVIVTDGGIVSISWHSPCQVSEMIADNTKIIDFAKAADILETKMKTFYEAKVDIYNYDSIEIEIDNIELGLLRIKQQNTEGKKAGLYVPVWAFYGTVKHTSTYSDGYKEVVYDHGCDFPDKPYIVLAINAINGSIIDVGAGY